MLRNIQKNLEKENSYKLFKKYYLKIIKMSENLKTFENFTKTLNELALSKDDYSRFDQYFTEIDNRKEIQTLTEKIDNLPSTEELAKKILTTKLPVDELPDDLKQMYTKLDRQQDQQKDFKSYTG